MNLNGFTLESIYEFILSYQLLEIKGPMASVFVLLEAFNRKEAAALGFFPCATAS